LQRTSKRLLIAAAIGLAFLLNVLFVESASAHVKWFCAYNVAGEPRGLENVLCPDFELLAGCAIIILFSVCIIEGTALGEAMMRALNRVTRWLRTNTELLFRAGCAGFFVALWAIGGILLTPELKTTWPAISWLQLAIAMGLISRKTMPFSALGIVFLFTLAVQQYGAFHLADYPIFLGIAAYLALVGLQRDPFGVRPLDLARWTTAVTLMWASVEKWAYPEWSFPLFIEYPGMNLGYDIEFFMRAAGVIEFTLAFSLVWTPLVRRFSAIVLAAMFVSAIFEFGKIDAIGHAPIIVVLLAIVADDVAAVRSKLRIALLAPIGYCIALAGFLCLYYVAHTLLFGTQIT
jgi:hypothetical protein